MNQSKLNDIADLIQDAPATYHNKTASFGETIDGGINQIKEYLKNVGGTEATAYGAGAGALLGGLSNHIDGEGSLGGTIRNAILGAGLGAGAGAGGVALRDQMASGKSLKDIMTGMLPAQDTALSFGKKQQQNTEQILQQYEQSRRSVPGATLAGLLPVAGPAIAAKMRGAGKDELIGDAGSSGAAGLAAGLPIGVLGTIGGAPKGTAAIGTTAAAMIASALMNGGRADQANKRAQATRDAQLGNM